MPVGVEAFALQPTSGPISGSLVTITGKGFLDRLGSIQAGVQCEDGSRAAMAAMRSMDSQVIVCLPQYAVVLDNHVVDYCDYTPNTFCGWSSPFKGMLFWNHI